MLKAYTFGDVDLVRSIIVDLPLEPPSQSISAQWSELRLLTSTGGLIVISYKSNDCANRAAIAMNKQYLQGRELLSFWLPARTSEKSSLKFTEVSAVCPELVKMESSSNPIFVIEREEFMENQVDDEEIQRQVEDVEDFLNSLL